MTSTLRTPTARTIARIVSMVLAVSVLCSCAASETCGRSGLPEETVTLNQLISLTFAE